MNVIDKHQSLKKFSIESVSSIDELRKILFICRSNNVIFPNKKGCLKYDLKHGNIVLTDKGPAVAIGTYLSKFWFQIKGDNGKISFWDTAYSPTFFTERGFSITSRRVEPQYITHYELYSILHDLDYYIYDDFSTSIQLIYPICSPIFFSPGILYSKNQEDIIKSEEDHISSLPLDTLEEIFQYCTPIDVFYSTLVCKSWRSLIKKCNIWKRFCKGSGIVYNEKLINSDYDENQAEYYFSRGLERRLTIYLMTLSDINSFYNKKYYLGGLYWSLKADGENFYIKLCDLSFNWFNGISISIIVRINTYDTNLETYMKYKPPEKLNILPEKYFLPLKCSITVKVHGSLINLMYRTALKYKDISARH